VRSSGIQSLGNEDGGTEGAEGVRGFPYLRDPKPLRGEEYNGQGELNGQGEQKSVEFDKSVVLWRGRSRLFGPWLAVDYRQELCTNRQQIVVEF